MAKLYLSLGHFYLLVYDYNKSLKSYQTFSKFKIYKLQVTFYIINIKINICETKNLLINMLIKDSTFYYGLGIVYFIFGAYK